MLHKFLPDEQADSVFEITPEHLKAKGIRGIITDLDNTLVAWDQENPTEKVLDWFQMMQNHGMKVTILSNNDKKRVSRFSEQLDIPFIYRARKPLARAFRKAQNQMGLQQEEVVVIGDQLLTDILGGNMARYHTILVVPISDTDGFVTRINRMIERRILHWMKKRGLISREE
ncbi:MAG: YqeG family HAD IIIA-type phosphatase [Bacillaceae bacterium]|nr:YqeG family HAD IIIA-type phosphatase [Bacillaceae bacterium]